MGESSESSFGTDARAPAPRAAARGIGPRLTLAVAGCSLGVAVVFSGLQFWLQHRRDLRLSEQRIESVSAGLQAGLAESLWNLRDDRLRLQLEGIVRLPDMLAAEVWEINEHGVPERRLRVSAPATAGQPAAAVDHRLELPLVHEQGGVQERIGLLRVEAGFAEQRQRLWQQALMQLLQQGLALSVVAVFVLLVVHFMVTRHLAAIADAVGRSDLRRPGAAAIRLQRRAPQRPDELDHVVATLNAQQGALERSFAELHDTNARLQQDIAARQEAERRAERLWRFYQAVSRSSRAIARMLPAQRLFDEICRICVETGHASMATLWMRREDGAAELRAASGPSEDLLGPAPVVFTPAMLENDPGTAVATALRTREPCVINDYLGWAGTATWHERAARHHILAAAALPVWRAGELAGALVVYGAERGFFDAPLVALLEEMAQDIGFGLDVLARDQESRAKSEFLSRMSHELRTPLNAILGFAQLMDADTTVAPLPPAQRQRLRLVRDAGWHLLALIEDLLDLSRIEAGHMELRLEPMPLAPVVDAALALIAPQADKAQVRLCSAGAPPGLALHADPLRVRQVLLNLLSNAVKYNRPGGSVRLEAARLDGTVRIEVIDDGIGMTPGQLARLFQPFDRLGREAGEVHGTGIGLVITRQLVLLMHGQMQVESTAGQGTCVRLVLPAAEGGADAQGAAAPAAAEAAPPPAAPDDMPAASLLYIEDDPVNQLLMQQYLARWPQLRLQLAGTGAAGLAAVRAQPVDLVLLDMGLPDMPGEQVLAALRDGDAPGGRVPPVIVLSATAMPGDVDKALAAGASAYVTKPVDFDVFGPRLRDALRRPAQAPA